MRLQVDGFALAGCRLLAIELYGGDCGDAQLDAEFLRTVLHMPHTFDGALERVDELSVLNICVERDMDNPEVGHGPLDTQKGRGRDRISHLVDRLRQALLPLPDL